MTSNQVWGPCVKQYVNGKYSNAHILDVGAGRGTYYNLLGDAHTLDAIEIYERYIEESDLRNKYKTVYMCNVLDFSPPSKQYDLSIFGDGLEHLHVVDAQFVVKLLSECANETLFIVPYMYPQEALNYNEWEEHKQPDLTPSIMLERYPTLHPLYIYFNPAADQHNRGIGVYTNVQPPAKSQEFHIPHSELSLPWFTSYLNYVPTVGIIDGGRQ